MPTFPLIQDQEPEDWWVQHASEQSVGVVDSLKAAGQLAIDRSPVAVLGDMYLKQKFSNMPLTKTLSVDELNQKYNGSGIVWSGPTNEVAAEMIAKDHERKQALARTIDLAGGGWKQGVANFALSTLINLPEYSVGGWAAGGAMRLAGVAGAATAGGAMARGAAEFAIGAAPSEFANLARDSQYEYDTSMTDSLKNLVLAGVMGAAVHGLSYKFKVGDYANKGPKEPPVDPISPEERALVAETAANQMIDGKRPMIAPLVQMMHNERVGAGPRPDTDFSGRSFNEFEPLPQDGRFEARVFNGTGSRVEHPGKLPPSAVTADGMNLGVGQPGTSDLFLENARSLPNNGLIHNMEVNGKFVNLDEPMKPIESKVLEKFLADNPETAARLRKDPNSGYKHGESAPFLRNVYNGLTQDEATELNRRLSQAGYDGLHYEGAANQNKHNGILIFPDKAEGVVKSAQALEPDERFAGTPSAEDIRKYIEAYNAPQNDLMHSEDELARLNEIQKRLDTQPISVEDSAYVDQVHQEQVENARRMLSENENLSEENRQLLQDIIDANKPKEPAPGQTPEEAKAEEESMTPEQPEHLRPYSPEEVAQREAEGRRILQESERPSRDSITNEYTNAIRELDNGQRTMDHADFMRRLDRLTELEQVMRQNGWPIPEVPGESANLGIRAEPTSEPAARRGWSVVDEKDLVTDGSKLEPGKARAYNAARTRAGDNFLIKLTGGEGGYYELTAYDKHGDTLGGVSFRKYQDGLFHVGVMDSVDRNWRGSGVGEALYREMNNFTDGMARPDRNGHTSARAWRSWRQNLPENFVNHVNELAQRQINRLGPDAADIFHAIGGQHATDDVRAAINAIQNGGRWEPEGVFEPGMRLAPLTADVPLAPGELPLAEQQRLGESSIKALFNCIGSE